MELRQLVSHAQENILERLLDSASRKSFGTGELLVDVGESMNGIPYIESGLIRVYRVRDDKEFLLYFLEAGELCTMGINCCLSHKGSPVRMYADVESEVLFLQPEVMMESMQQDAEWMQFVMRAITDKFMRMAATIDDLTFGKLEDRIFHHLEDHLDRGNSPATHSQIANDLNTSREGVGRAIKKMLQEGRLISEKGQLHIP